jgi:hypothetical protein
VQVGSPTAHHSDVSAAVTTPTPLDTPYFTASLPSNFAVKRQNSLANGGPVLFQLSANTDGRTDKQFGATIGVTPAEGLSGLSDYKLRSSDTATYATYTPVGLPPGATAFHTISGPAEVTIFWPHGGHYAELSFSTNGTASQSALEDTFRSVIASWDWK